MPQKPLVAYLTDEQQREIADVRNAAEHILAQPLDHEFTDHTISHSDRIREHLDTLLIDWAEMEFRETPERTRAEIFILLAAVYLHDIGMQFQLFDQCPSIEKYLPSLSEALQERGQVSGKDMPFTPESLAFARMNHHLLTYDWITGSNLRAHTELLPFEETKLKSYVDHVARVAWSHNIWLTNELSYDGYERELSSAQEQVGKIRIGLLAAFLRIGDLLDFDHRRVDVNKLRSFPISPLSKAHWWKHHFIRTSRLDDKRTDDGRRLHLVLTVPRQHDIDLTWLKPALCTIVIEQLREEQDRLRNWLAPAGIWIDLPKINECEVKIDVSGRIYPMPPDAIPVFREMWHAIKGASAREEIKDALDTGKLELLKDETIRTLSIQAEIEDYLRQVENQHEQSFRDTPYTPIELDYGEFLDALDALEALLDKPDPIPRPIVVIGDPGGGKTTLLRRYVLDCARKERSPGLLPFYLQANRYGDPEWAAKIDQRFGTAQCPAPEAERHLVAAELVQHLLLLMAETLCDLARVSYQHREAMLHYVHAVMARTNCLIVIDGLNEVPPLQRGLAIFAVKNFVKEYRNHRIVITSREGDYHEDFFSSSAVHRVKSLRDDAIRSYWSSIGIGSIVQERVFSSDNKEIAELARNPMYMFMLGELLKAENTDVITAPGLLFQRFTGESLRRWYKGDARALILPEEMRGLLAEVAYHALNVQAVSFSKIPIQKGVDTWWNRLPALRQEELSVALDLVIQFSNRTDSETKTVDMLIQRMIATGFLQRQGQAESPRFIFRHHTTQDYFAAVAIACKVEELPDVVSRPIFHEALRIVPTIIENPNEFLRRLMGATSKGFGRTYLLGLSFRVAGSIQGRLEKDVEHQLFAGTVPLLQAVAGLHLPYAAEVLGYLFHHIGWHEMGRFLAQSANNSALPRSTRDFAAKRIAKVMVHDEAPTKEAISELLSDEIPSGILGDFEQCKAILERVSGEENRLGPFSLLLGGAASTISLSVDEKFRVARSVGQITPNQIGVLQMIFIGEIISWGALSLERVYDAELLTQHQEDLVDLLLYEEDALILQGQISEAIAGYFVAITRIGTQSLLLERLVLLSSYMTLEQLAKLGQLICSYKGKFFGGVRRNNIPYRYSTALKILRRKPEVHTSVRAHFDAISWCSSPWLLLWRDLLTSHQSSSQFFMEHFEEMATKLDLEQPSGMIFLQSVRDSLYGSDKGKVDAMLEKYCGINPTARIEKLKETIRALPSEQIATELTRQTLNVGYSNYAVSRILAVVLDTCDSELLLPFIESLHDLDQEVERSAQLCFLTKLAQDNAVDGLRQYMKRWDFNVKDIAECAYSDKTILRALYAAGDHELVLGALTKRDLILAVTLLEEDGDFNKASQTALRGFNTAITDGCSPEPFADAIKRLAQVMSSKAKGSADELLRTFARQLLPLLGDSVNGDWAFKRVEQLRKSGHVDLGAYTTRIGQVLRSGRMRTNADDRSLMLGILSETGHHFILLECLDAYTDACPRDPTKAASYLGNGAWYAYLAGNYEHFEHLTENALTLAPDGYRKDWLLSNRALALLIRGAEKDALDAYQETRQAVFDSERWQEVALDDLEHHPDRWTDAIPFPQDFIDAVKSLGEDLPEPSPTENAEPAERLRERLRVASPNFKK